MTAPKFTPEEVAVWAKRAQEYVKIIDSEIAGWRDVATNRMIQAVAEDKGWAGNNDVEYAVARVVNLLMMRTVAEGVMDAFTVTDMLNGSPTDQAG
ncbi:MAG: hypothetical protein J0I04_02430 [Paenarthrobacter ureafaciens]|uniref:hypothetical protein n=1 Tax=Paenarthrobacter ureafaciens TaxID=37931 RepID=UPI001AC368C5|nr:hypothetical protein [Paenarthrobacter ureafaciens]MBN9128495.1 hypothetical protein [Paenarthrobacter ureafaciens]